MNLKVFLLVFILLTGVLDSATAQSCPCILVFDSLLKHLEINYPGYLVTAKRSDFVSWNSIQRSEILKVTQAKQCSEKLQNYLSIFKDGHIGIRFKGDIFKKEKPTKFAPVWPEITDSIAREYLDKRADFDSLEGIWESYEGLYKVFIQRKMNTRIYEGFLLESVNQNWKKGEVKMIFTPNDRGKIKLQYFMSSHKFTRPDFDLNRNILEIKNRIVFQKIYPKIPNPIPFESFVSGSFGLSEDFIQWNSETYYIQLQNISAGNKPLIDSLIRKNDWAIRQSKNLVIDLRDNEGGDFTCFENLWPFILTDPSVIFGTTYRCTQANIAAYKAQLNQIEDEVIPEFQDFAKELETHIGLDWKIPNDTIHPEAATSLPKHVILLVNQKCKSSTENFILTAGQSKKVIVAGETTGGVADYEELVDFPLACKEMTLQMPIGKSNRLPSAPLDGIGIEPQIKLKSKNKAWQPWVKEVLRQIKD